MNKELLRYKKYKRGAMLEIVEKFGNGEETKTMGYYWMNDATNKRMVLISSLPPFKLNNKLMEKRFCNYDLIKEINIIKDTKQKQTKESD